MANAVRLASVLVWVVFGAGCVDVPERPKEPNEPALDGAIGDPLSADGGPERPATGAPYSGPECDGTGSPSAPGAPATGPGGSGAPVPRAGSSAQSSDGGTHAMLPAMAGAAADAGTPPLPEEPRPSAPGEVVITEVMSNPEALRDDVGEWFELYNPSDQRAVSLAGCAIDDGGERPRPLAGPLVIEPLGFAVIARSEQVAFVADLVMSFSLGNTEDRLALLCDGVEIDRVAYGAGYPLLAGASLALDPGALDASANDAAEAWCPAPAASTAGDRGSPGAPNPDCAAADAGTD